jgi:hypothetical protein
MRQEAVGVRCSVAEKGGSMYIGIGTIVAIIIIVLLVILLT